MGQSRRLQVTEEREIASRTGPERRDSDWGGHPRTHEEDLAWAAKRAAVSMAAATIHARDGATGAHSDDVVHLCDAIADELAVHGDDRAELLAAAQLHDIGKVGIPHEVLDKPGPLDDRQWELIRKHTIAGEQIVQSVPELKGVARLVRHSHERWDGAGYPDGLAGEDIPLASRIVFCADAFHAIRSDRPYRRGRPARAALDEVKRNAGSQFDPEVADALVKSAVQMGDTFSGGARGLATSLRSRRLASLLLTLAIGGSALAAGGSYLLRDESDAAPHNAAPAAGTAGDTVGDGWMPKWRSPASTGESPATANRVKRRNPPAIPGNHARVTGPGRPARPTRHAAPGRRTRPKRHVASTPVAEAPANLPTVPTRLRAGRRAAPGRSGEAPRRPAQPGTPVGGAPGRSEEAPARPSQPVP